MTGDFLDSVSCGAGSDAELVVVVLTSLVLFMFATYLLIKRGSAWHTVAGIAVGLVAALYMLAVGDVISVESIWDGRLWTQALQLVGLG